jgi:hypothetical protein
LHAFDKVLSKPFQKLPLHSKAKPYFLNINCGLPAQGSSNLLGVSETMDENEVKLYGGGSTILTEP